MKEYDILRYSHDGSMLFHRTDCFRRRCSSCVSDFGDRCPKCGLPLELGLSRAAAQCRGCGTKLKVRSAAVGSFTELVYAVTGWDEPTGLFPSVEEYDTI